MILQHFENFLKARSLSRTSYCLLVTKFVLEFQIWSKSFRIWFSYRSQKTFNNLFHGSMSLNLGLSRLTFNSHYDLLSFSNLRKKMVDNFQEQLIPSFGLATRAKTFHNCQLVAPCFYVLTGQFLNNPTKIYRFNFSVLSCVSTKAVEEAFPLDNIGSKK